jgi:phage terminase large subunit GpA-like protein
MISPEHVLAEFAGQFFQPRIYPDPVAWCTAEVQIDDRGDNAYRGPFSLNDVPDAPPILRSMCDPLVETTVIVGPTQSLKTTLLIGAASYKLKHYPGSLTWVMDSTDNCRGFSKNRLQPTFAATPAITGLYLGEDDAITNLEIVLRTGTVRFAGSNSPGKIASFPANTVVGDEVDKYPTRLRNEAGTLDLVRERLSGSYASAQTWLASTPTVAHGTIWLEAHKGDCRKFHSPCIHCGKEFIWSFAQLRWDEAAKGADGRWDMARVERTAHYQCPHCEREIFEHHRRDMMHAGRWIPTELNPIDPRRHSYFRNCFHVLSPKRTFARIAQKHLEAGRDPSARQNFTNSWLAEVSREESLTIAALDVQQRAEVYLVEPKTKDEPLILPSGPLVLTAGVDVQESPPRLEAEIVGHGEAEETWGIEYRVFHGDPSGAQVWADLDRWLLRRWLHPGGFVLSPAAVCIDTGYLPDIVYQFCKPRLGRHVFATKGSSGGYGEPLVSRARKSGVHALPLFMIGTTTAKEIVYHRLQLTTPGAGFCHFPQEPRRGYDAAYYRQLTAEECHVVWKAGRKVKKFVNPSGRRNEALDIRCLALAARELRNPDLAVLAEQARQAELELSPHENNPSSSSPEIPAAAPEGHQPEAMEPAQAGPEHHTQSDAPVFDPATGRIDRPSAPEEAMTPAAIQAATPNTYKPINAAPAAKPGRRFGARKNFATSW